MPKCRICRAAEADSFEHTPPQKAFNKGALTAYSLLEYLARDADGKIPGGVLEPRGAGAPVLCESCNSKTGSWYGAELVRFVQAGGAALAKAPRDQLDSSTEPMWGQFAVERMPEADVSTGPYPLRFAKHIVTMMLATAEGLSEMCPELCTFVLDRKQSGLPPRFRLYLSFFAGPLGRQTGLQRIEMEGRPITLAEVAFPPFAYVLTIDTDKDLPPDICEITCFAHVGYDDKATALELDLLMGFGHTAFPCDYRTKAMLERDRSAN
jgi:hypothetical protein